MRWKSSIKLPSRTINKKKSSNMIPLNQNDFVSSFPAIRGVQSGREYYVAMCPLQYIPRLFSTVDSDLPPELRAQRGLNKSRIPALARYILENPTSYVFSSLTASIDGEVAFKPLSEAGPGRKLGVLVVPMGARILINDGQHRKAAIVQALSERPELKHETISIVFFVDAGLKQSQQMFADLNRYAVRPTKSLGILYDYRDSMARLVNELIDSVPVFRDMTEKAKSTISNRSLKLFTLSSIYQATRRLLDAPNGDDFSTEQKELAQSFWIEVSDNMPDWQDALNHSVAPSELRSQYVHAHGIALQALAIVGSSLIASSTDNWKTRLRLLREIDWSRNNSQWEGRAMIAGRLNKSENNVVLTANVIKAKLGLPFSPTEQQIERLHVRAKS